ncbi:type I polyketide synthase [Nocardioides campestrisoli]|uniref:type I polyketide synthase n=1 Tax=Nocardioides campestrisoli TaxID=2736757 RepID=UPI00163D9C0F|nr:4'-phosphopantetheinyl transferase superfamily protein [Nocardioides campestrisoli]
MTEPRSTDDGEELLLLAGADAADLLAQLTAWSATPEDRRMLPPVPPPASGPARLAVVAPDARRLTLATKVLTRGTPFRGRNDVWFDPEGSLRDGGKVAFLFPGVEPEFAPLVADVAEHFDLAWEGLADHGEREWALQDQGRGIIAVGRLLAAALARLGVRPDAIAGHSLGEWTGQVVSGMVPDAALDGLLTSLRPGAIQVSDVVFLALGCGVEVAEELVAGLPDAHVSHDNCPHQSIACAPAEVAAAVRARAAERKVLAQELPFRSGFHSPLFAPMVDAMWAQFSDLPLLPAKVPLWSATSCEPYPDDADGITALSLRHLVEPVRFRALTTRLYDEGVRAFVQVGTGSLIGFVDDTLRGQDVLTVAAASARIPGVAQLRRVAAALWSAGAPVDLEQLGHPGPSGHHVPEAPASVAAVPTHAPEAAGTVVPAPAPVAAATPAAVPSPEVAPAPAPAPGTAPAPALPAALLAEYQALLAETAEAAHAVLAAAATAAPRPLRVTRQTRPAVLPASDDVPPLLEPVAEPAVAPLEPAAALLEPATGHSAGTTGPGQGGSDPVSRQRVVRLSIAEQPWWADHAFFQQPDGWPCVEDTFPLVPMTGIVQMMVEEAEALVPGTVAVRVESVRAFKWLAVEPAVEVTVRAAVDPVSTQAANEAGLDEPGPPDHCSQHSQHDHHHVPGHPGPVTVVRASIDGHARAVVHLAAAHSAPPRPWNRFLRGRLEMPVPVEEIYTRRHLFHGPSYQGIRSIERFAGDGVRGTLVSQPATGALLDNAGQLFGYWFACAVDKDRMVLPTTMDAISFYGPHPAPGALVDCVAHCTELTDDAVRADLELLVDGVLWCRIEGWEDRRFQSDDRLFTVLKVPQPHLLAEPQPGGWMLVREGWPDSPSRDLVMRRFLGAEERQDYHSRNPRAQRTWLLGRIAAKDAVRREVVERGREPLFPVEVRIANERSGRPVASTPTELDLRVSIAHSGQLGVAVAAVGHEVGIDIELVAERSSIFESASLSPQEHALFLESAPHGRDRDRELTRWWAAKEAAAKAIGTGLQGRPKDFEVVEVDFHHLRVGDQWVATRSLYHPDQPDQLADPDQMLDPDHQAPATPAVAAREEYIVAWTVPDPSHG